MIAEKQIVEIRSFLEKSESPLFFFDDDPDGLSAYLLLKRRYQKGRGICVKASPNVEDIYVRKIEEYGPDLVVILDRPVLSQELVDKVKVPMVWIDHHQPVDLKGVKYYNPMVPDKKDNRSTSYWCYRVADNPKDMWIALAGIIGDWQVPEFIEEFEYRELLNKKKTAPEMLFESDLGTLIKVFSFVMKGKTSEVRSCISILEKIESPYQILKQETPKGRYIYKKFEKLNKEYQALLKKALKEKVKGDVYVFTYPPSTTSFTSMLTNEVLFRTKYKVIILGRDKDDEMRLSLRGRDVEILPILQRVLTQVRGYGGGHMFACGAGIKKDDFKNFVELFRKEVSQK